ncbi:armadillo-type protein [Pelagophyceae sp. CCMP2097]|nr:armadillo-type protein [Pelagophyceae sp. CCMP2097]
MEELVRSLEVLARCPPGAPDYSDAAARLTAFEGGAADELCCALAALVAHGGAPALSEPGRLFAAVALKNVLDRRAKMLGAATLAQLRRDALSAVKSESGAAKRGASLLVEALSLGAQPWPELAAALHGMLSTTDAAAALRVLADLVAGDDDARRRGPFAADLARAELDALVSAVVALAAAPDAAVRRNALDVATSLGWLSRASAAASDGSALAALSSLASDVDGGVRGAVLRALRALLRAGTLDSARIVGVADFCLGALGDGDSAVALAAAEWFAALARGCERRRPECAAAADLVVDRVVPRLLQAMCYTQEDVDEFAADARRMTVGVADADDDVRPRYASSGVVDSDDDDDDDDEAEADSDEPCARWTLRKCSASALDAFARAGGARVASAALPHIITALEAGGVWDREAALLALGALAGGAEISELAPTLVPFVLRQTLCDETPQLREISAWVLERCANAWLPLLNDTDANRLVADFCDALAERTATDGHKRVVEAAASALAAVLEAGAPRLGAPAAALAPRLAAAVVRAPPRARFAVYAAVQALAQHAPLAAAEILGLLRALEPRWHELAAATPAWKALPLLQCAQALARAPAAAGTYPHGADLWAFVAARCFCIVRFGLADDDCGAATAAAHALDVVSAMRTPLGPAFANVVAAEWDAVQGPLAAHVEPCAVGDRRAAAAAAAAALVGDCATDAALGSRVSGAAPLLLSCVEVAHRDSPPAVAAAHNALWALGELAKRLPPSPDLQRALGHAVDRLALLLLTDADADRIRLLVRNHADPSTHLASHAALTLGACVARSDVGDVSGLFDAAQPRGAACFSAWARALAKACADADADDAIQAYAALHAVAAKNAGHAHREATDALLCALAAWQRRQPPVSRRAGGADHAFGTAGR